jgi:hypothetical protein
VFDTLVTNNLGNQGPQNTENDETMRFSSVLTTNEGTVVDAVIRVADTDIISGVQGGKYLTTLAANNGVYGDDIVTISAGSVPVSFQIDFYETYSDIPITLETVSIAFFDLDRNPEGSGFDMVCIPKSEGGKDWAPGVLEGDLSVFYEGDNKCWRGKKQGYQCDNPTSSTEWIFWAEAPPSVRNQQSGGISVDRPTNDPSDPSQWDCEKCSSYTKAEGITSRGTEGGYVWCRWPEQTTPTGGCVSQCRNVDSDNPCLSACDPSYLDDAETLDKNEGLGAFTVTECTDGLSGYEFYTCVECQQDPDFQYCQWDNSFNADGGCLPTKPDGIHVPCGDWPGDVLVQECSSDNFGCEICLAEEGLSWCRWSEQPTPTGGCLKTQFCDPDNLGDGAYIVDTCSSAAYTFFNCRECQEAEAPDGSGYTFCQWEGQFTAAGGCLPNVADGNHVPCGDWEGDVTVRECPEGNSMVNFNQCYTTPFCGLFGNTLTPKGLTCSASECSDKTNAAACAINPCCQWNDQNTIQLIKARDAYPLDMKSRTVFLTYENRSSITFAAGLIDGVSGEATEILFGGSKVNTLECRVCEDTSVLVDSSRFFIGENLLYNNLGGMGPNNDPEMIRYGNQAGPAGYANEITFRQQRRKYIKDGMSVGDATLAAQTDAGAFDVVMTVDQVNASQNIYKVFSSGRNGVPSRGSYQGNEVENLVQMNLLCGTYVEVDVSFVKTVYDPTITQLLNPARDPNSVDFEGDEPVTLKHVQLSLHDLDTDGAQQVGEEFCVHDPNFEPSLSQLPGPENNYVSVKIEEKDCYGNPSDTNSYTFTALRRGFNCDNPTHANHLVESNFDKTISRCYIDFEDSSFPTARINPDCLNKGFSATPPPGTVDQETWDGLVFTEYNSVCMRPGEEGPGPNADLNNNNKYCGACRPTCTLAANAEQIFEKDSGPKLCEDGSFQYESCVPAIAFPTLGEGIFSASCLLNQKWGKYYPQDQAAKSVFLAFSNVSSVKIVTRAPTQNGARNGGCGFDVAPGLTPAKASQEEVTFKTGRNILFGGTVQQLEDRCVYPDGSYCIYGVDCDQDIQ